MSPFVAFVSCALASLVAGAEPPGAAAPLPPPPPPLGPAASVLAAEALPPPPPPAGPGATAPAAEVLPPPPPPASAQSPSPADSGGLVPGVRFGPKVSVLPLPGLVGIGLEVRIKDAVTLGVDYGVLPELHVPAFSESNAIAPGVSNEISDGRLSYRDLGFAARFIPWEGAFHVGAAYGVRTFKASAKGTATASGISASAVASIEATSTYLAPEIGWRWIRPSGFFMGLDVGWQLILSQSTNVDVPAYAFPPGKTQDYADLANRIASSGLPVLSLLQLGWYL